MKKRDLIKNLGVSLLFAGMVMSAGCSQKNEVTSEKEKAVKTYKWKMVTTWPKNFPGLGTGANNVAKLITKMSGGRITVKVYGAKELVPAFEVFDAVSRGTAEMGHGAAYYWKGKNEALQFFSTVPFGLTAQEMNGWLYHGDGMKLWEELYDKFNLIPNAAGNTGVQMGGWFNKKINSIADLKGLKMRMPGLGGKVLAKAGGTPVLLAGGEIYTALERGTIDATEWVGPYHDERLGLYRAAKYYYFPGWHEPGPTLELIVNKEAWASLSLDLQAIVESAASASNIWMLAQFEAKNLAALRILKEKHKVEVLSFPDEVLLALKKYTKEVLQEKAANDPEFEKIYRDYVTFSADNDSWNTLSEAAYQRAKTLK